MLPSRGGAVCLNHWSRNRELACARIRLPVSIPEIKA